MSEELNSYLKRHAWLYDEFIVIATGKADYDRELTQKACQTAAAYMVGALEDMVLAKRTRK